MCHFVTLMSFIKSLHNTFRIGKMEQMIQCIAIYSGLQCKYCMHALIDTHYAKCLPKNSIILPLCPFREIPNE